MTREITLFIVGVIIGTPIGVAIGERYIEWKCNRQIERELRARSSDPMVKYGLWPTNYEPLNIPMPKVKEIKQGARDEK